MDIDILIEIVKATPGVLIAAVVTYYFSQRKYTFEKLYDRKLAYIEEIFEKIVLLEDYLKKYVLTIGSMADEATLVDRKKALKPIQDHFFELRKLFRKKEILFSQNTIDSLQSFIDVSIEILSNLEVSNISLQLGDDKSAYDQWNKAYEAMSKKMEIAKEALKEDFRSVIESKK